MRVDNACEELNKSGFIEAVSKLARTEQIAEYVGYSEEAVRERMFKLEDEDEVVSKPDGAGVWTRAKKSE
jgi:DNA-binding Lrp family transcriptional regulator